MTWKNSHHCWWAFVERLQSKLLSIFPSSHFCHFTDDESDDIDANNNRNSPNTSHRHGYSLENNESTDSSYKSYNNFNENRESNYHDNKNYDMHKKHRWVAMHAHGAVSGRNWFDPQRGVCSAREQKVFRIKFRSGSMHPHDFIKWNIQIH